MYLKNPSILNAMQYNSPIQDTCHRISQYLRNKYKEQWWSLMLSEIIIALQHWVATREVIIYKLSK